MKAFHDEILRNTIAYVAKRYYELTGRYIVQILMYKILALVDYQCVRETGVPCTELDYWAENRGPVPHDLKTWNDEGLSVKQPKKINGHDAYVFICTGEPDMDYLSEYEKDLLDEYINRAVAEKWDAHKASMISHDEIRAWGIARDRDNHKMSYEDEFKDLRTKPYESLTETELRFLDYERFTVHAAV